MNTSVWQAFSAEAESEAEKKELEFVEMYAKVGKVTVVTKGTVDNMGYLHQHLSEWLDNCTDTAYETVPPFILEVASPGLSDVLEDDQYFITFKGFEVIVTLSEQWKKKKLFEGTLIGRDEEFVTINVKGQNKKIPRGIVKEVRLPKAKRE